MVELKFKDIKSLNAVTGALHKNGYRYSTFVVWGDCGLDHYTVQIERVHGTIENSTLRRCNKCKHRYVNEHGEPCCNIWAHGKDTVIRDNDFCSYWEMNLNAIPAAEVDFDYAAEDGNG